MARPRIALLNAAHEPEQTRRNFRREVDADLVEYHLPGGDQPETFDVDAAIVTGSRASVYSEEPWIDEAKPWTREAIDRGLPFLGICFGHQFLADVMGGTVEDMGEYEIGYRKIERGATSGSADSPLLAGLEDRFTVFTTHSDRVAELPPGAELLAENDYGVHGFRKGDVFGLQAHPEYDMASAETVTRGKEGQLDAATMEAVLEGIHEENYAAACEAKRIFENFLDVVRETRGDSGGATVASDD